MWRALRGELPVIIAGAAAAIALLSGAVGAHEVGHIVDWRLLAVLFSLLVSVEALRVSNLLDHVVRASAARFDHKRSFTLALVALSGALAAVMTNDVALFVVIPFMMAATRLADFDADNAVMLQIVAANLIGCISPLGNPQNLFVYQLSGMNAGTFVLTMAPFVVFAAAILAVSVRMLERGGDLQAESVVLAKIDVPRAVAGAIGFALVFLHVLHVLPIAPAAIAATLVLPFVLAHEESRVDLSIAPLFFCAFIAVEALRRTGAYRLVGGGAPSDLRLYLSAVGASQVISNVPATILLAPLSAERWRLLLYGVNAGGCGTIIASLANLLGWQIYRRHGGHHPRFLARFMMLNVVLLVVLGAGGWLLCRLAGR